MSKEGDELNMSVGGVFYHIRQKLEQYGEPFVSKWRYKIPCVGVPKINSTLSGRDRLDVFYQLDFIQVRIDSMCFINSILSR